MATNSRRLADALIQKLSKRLKILEPSSPQRAAALNKIGIVLRNRMVMNATSLGIVDRGALRNSLTYRIERNTVVAGSFGVPYAKFHEFGATLPPAAVRAMFAAMRRRGGPKRKPGGKGVFKGNAITGGVLRARPFVRPALQSEHARILQILRDSAAKSR